MSKTKKVLSLVMAIALVFNVLAVISSAACADDKVIGFSAETDDALVAGGQVTVDFYIELPADTDVSTYKLGLFQLIVSYNADVLTPVSRTWGDTYAEFMASTNGFNTTSSTVHGWISKYLTTDEAAKYTASCAVAGSQVDTTNEYGYTGSTGYCLKSTKDKIFSITFDVSESYDGTATADVAILQNAFQNATRCYYRDITTVGGKVAKDGSQTDFTESAVVLSAPAAAAKKVYHVKNQIQWADKENNKVNLGIVCGFDIADIGIAFENGTSTNVSSVGVTATINGVTDTYTERFVYSAKEGTAYYFRAVIGNVPGDYTGTIEITPFVVVDGTTEYGDPIEITADVLASNVAKLPA